MKQARRIKLLKQLKFNLIKMGKILDKWEIELEKKAKHSNTRGNDEDGRRR